MLSWVIMNLPTSFVVLPPQCRRLADSLAEGLTEPAPALTGNEACMVQSPDWGALIGRDLLAFILPALVSDGVGQPGPLKHDVLPPAVSLGHVVGTDADVLAQLHGMQGIAEGAAVAA